MAEPAAAGRANVTQGGTWFPLKGGRLDLGVPGVSWRLGGVGRSRWNGARESAISFSELATGQSIAPRASRVKRGSLSDSIHSNPVSTWNTGFARG
jgi:hypothetical protein